MRQSETAGSLFGSGMDSSATVGQLAAAADPATLLEGYGGGAIVGGMAVGLLGKRNPSLHSPTGAAAPSRRGRSARGPFRADPGANGGLR
jgi:hypothetical protein